MLKRIPIRTDSLSNDQPTTLPHQKELPPVPSPSRPRHLRLNHKVLSTIYESSADENKARWSIRPVPQHEDEHEEDVPDSTTSPGQDDEDERSMISHSSSHSSKLEISVTSTDPTSVTESQICNISSTTDHYTKAYQEYRIISLTSRKLTFATNLHTTLDKTQLLTNQLHVSTLPFNILTAILHQPTKSSSTLEDLREQVASQQAAIKNKTEDIRLTVRTLLTSNQSLIRESEVLLKENAKSNLELFTQERLAVNRLMATLASNEHVKVEKDQDLEHQQNTLTTFNEYVGSLVENLEMQNVGLESLIREVNQKVKSLEGEIDICMREERWFRGIFRKILLPSHR
ncbi:hypothetical protein D6D15_01797 [Aureobasidium pullulans]|uniref:Uncharacterized protein n=1 Tax=Aureobasidium pullulans TaxID=5580 RepID=A0A4S9BMP9_AURPU|nr:hypothetical protein D6D15_01797 [Aureobasidium pullulans]